MVYTVGSVPYVNAAPLIARFDALGERSPVQVRTAVPSRLPALLDSGQCQAIMVSSVDALRHPGRRIVGGIGVGSSGPVESVRLFSKVPFENIRSLVLDESSMTSNRLAQVLLADGYGVHPVTTTHGPDLHKMLAHGDACVLIGDRGFEADGTSLHVMDLGAEWTRQTGLPFLWAGWIGGSEVTAALADLLHDARVWSGCGRGCATELAEGRDETIAFAMRQSGWSEAMARHYLLETMVYDHTSETPLFDGLREFQRRLLANGFDDCRHLPEIVPARSSVIEIRG